MNYRFQVQKFITDRDVMDEKRRNVKSFKTNFADHKFCQKDVRGNTGCVNSLQFSTDEKMLASGGDDTKVRIWRVDDMMMRRAPKPRAVMDQQHSSNIFSLAFDLEDRSIYSGERCGDVFKHDVESQKIIHVSRKHRFAEDVFHLHQNPTDTHVLAVTRCRMVSFLDDRDLSNPTVFHEAGKFYSAEFHPSTPRLLLVNSRKEGPNVFDLRYPATPLFKLQDFQGLPQSTGRNRNEWMAGQWSPSGNQYLSLRNNAQPIYFDLLSRRCFILNSDTYMNVNTVKSMTFIDDRHVATGSDNWGIHVWRIPQGDEGFDEVPRLGQTDLVVSKEITVLKGHRSIPNQVAYSTQNNLLVSSGVENIVKLWSDLKIPWSYDEPFKRNTIFRYSSTRESETQREKEERRVLEEALDREGEMDGRATWQDVFGGDSDTGEDRNTLEQFDTMEQVDVDVNSDEDPYRRNRRYFVLADVDSDINSDEEEDVDVPVQIHDEEHGAFRPLPVIRRPAEPRPFPHIRRRREPLRQQVRAPLMGSPSSSTEESESEARSETDSSEDGWGHSDEDEGEADGEEEEEEGDDN